MGEAGYQYRNRKSKALHPTTIPCLGAVHSVNVINGSSRPRLFAHHRRAPIVTTDLPRQLDEELARAARRDALPPLLVFGTDGDAFEEGELVRELQLQAMGFALKRGVAVAFATRGPIGEAFVALFQRYPGQVHPVVTLSVMPETSRLVLEPHAQPLDARMADLEALLKAGVHLSARLDPLVPFVGDDRKRLDQLFKRLYWIGVRHVSGVSPTLHPTALADFEPSLPAMLHGLLLGAFGLKKSADLQTRAARTRGVAVPARSRHAMFEAVHRAADDRGLLFRPCLCAHRHAERPAGCFSTVEEMVAPVKPVKPVKPGQMELL